MIFENNKIYDVLKILALIALPVGTFVSSFCTIWGIGYGEQIHQTFIALDVLLGAFVTASNVAYNSKEGGDSSE